MRHRQGKIESDSRRRCLSQTFILFSSHCLRRRQRMYFFEERLNFIDHQAGHILHFWLLLFLLSFACSLSLAIKYVCIHRRKQTHEITRVWLAEGPLAVISRRAKNIFLLQPLFFLCIVSNVRVSPPSPFAVFFVFFLSLLTVVRAYRQRRRCVRLEGLHRSPLSMWWPKESLHQPAKDDYSPIAAMQQDCCCRL